MARPDHAGNGHALPDHAARVTRAKGCPGGGKSHWLFQRLGETIENGADFSDIYFLTFSNAGRAEAEGRLVDMFDAENMAETNKRRVENRAKTVHGAACSAVYAAGVIDDVGEQVIEQSSNPEVFERFCEQTGLKYTQRENNPLKADRQGYDVSGSGNRLFGTYQWLKLNRLPFNRVADVPLKRPIPSVGRTIELLQEWDDFKRNGDANGTGARVFEHVDYVDEAIDGQYPVGATYLFIDEFQDLAPQEYELFKTWRDGGEVDHLYIAGDDAQSIYSFRAATPRYFRKTPVDDEVDLTLSHRCPSVITSVANGTVAGVPGTTDGNGPHIRTNRIGGSATRERIETPHELVGRVTTDADRDGHAPNDKGYSVFLLARTNRQVSRIGRAFDGAGVPYSAIGVDDYRQPWGGDHPALYKALRAIDQGRDMQHMAPQIRDTFRGYYAGPAKTTTELAKTGVDAVIRDLTGVPDGRDYPLAKDSRDRLRNAVHRDAIMDPASDARKISIGTIHKAKGLQAPCVYLFDGYGAKMEQAHHSDPETKAEEHRVYYVGVTRASKTLVVATGYENMGTAVFPGFKNGLPRSDHEWSADATQTEVSE